MRNCFRASDEWSHMRSSHRGALKRSWWGTQWGATVMACAMAGCVEADADQEQRPIPAGTPVEISEPPHLVVGDDSSDPIHAFHRVVTPVLLPDGSLAVPLAGENMIRVFDEDGNLTRTHGGEGEGPGEFVTLAAAWVDGVVIEAFDSRQRQVTRIHPDGEVEVVRLEGEAVAHGAVPVLEDGTRAAYGVRAVAPNGRDQLVLHHFTSTGESLGDLLEFSGMRRYEFPGGTGPDPLSPRAIVRAHGEEIFVAETTDTRIRGIHASSGTSRIIEWDRALTEFPGDARSYAREAALQRAGSEEVRAAVEERFRALAGDVSVSGFWDFIIDELGFFWIRPFEPAVHGPDVGGMGGPGPGGTWIVLSPEGEHVAKVDVPGNLEPMAIQANSIVGIRRDERGVESVAVHVVERIGGGEL